jgi:hypothetical protein
LVVAIASRNDVRPSAPSTTSMSVSTVNMASNHRSSSSSTRSGRGRQPLDQLECADLDFLRRARFRLARRMARPFLATACSANPRNVTDMSTSRITPRPSRLAPDLSLNRRQTQKHSRPRLSETRLRQPHATLHTYWTPFRCHSRISSKQQRAG